jgi:predicted membrane protein
MLWTALSAIAVVALLIFWRGPNAVWGGIGLGIIGGLVTATALVFTGAKFRWPLVEKWVVICTLFGVAVEVLGKILERDKNHDSHG